MGQWSSKNQRSSQNFDTEVLKTSLAKVVRAFAKSPEGGAFFLKYTLLPDTKEHNEAIEDVYNEILQHFQENKQLAEAVVSSLKNIRECCLHNGSKATQYVQHHIDSVIGHKAFVDYVKDTRSSDALLHK